MSHLEMEQELCGTWPCCPEWFLMYVNDNTDTAYLLQKRHPSIVTAQALWTPICKSLSVLIILLLRVFYMQE